LNADPGHARAAGIRKKSNIAKFSDHLVLSMNGGERIADLDYFFGRNLANEFQRYVQIVGIYPFRIVVYSTQLTNQRSKALLDFPWSRQGHKETHR
jgi:hypothetical protein